MFLMNLITVHLCTNMSKVQLALVLSWLSLSLPWKQRAEWCFFVRINEGDMHITSQKLSFFLVCTLTLHLESVREFSRKLHFSAQKFLFYLQTLGAKYIENSVIKISLFICTQLQLVLLSALHVHLDPISLMPHLPSICH